LNRNQLVRKYGCKNFTCKRQEFVFNKPVHRFENRCDRIYINGNLEEVIEHITKIWYATDIRDRRGEK